jgi:hypothetical protein
LLVNRLLFVIPLVVLAAACSSAGHNVVLAPPVTTAQSATTATSSVALSTAAGGSTGSCAARLPGSIDSPGVRGLAKTMVPINATAVRVCRYSPLDAKVPNQLVRSGVAGAVVTQQLERETNALHHIPNAERIPCPLVPNTPGWTIAFAGATTSVTLVVSASDCGFVTNGSVTAGPTTAWLDALGRIADGR